MLGSFSAKYPKYISYQDHLFKIIRRDDAVLVYDKDHKYQGCCRKGCLWDQNSMFLKESVDLKLIFELALIKRMKGEKFNITDFMNTHGLIIETEASNTSKKKTTISDLICNNNLIIETKISNKSILKLII